MQTLNGEILITALQKISGCTPNRFAQYLGTTNKTVQDWIDRATGKKHGFMKNMSELWNPNKLLEILIEFKKKRFGGDNDKITRALLKALKGLQIDIQKYEETYEQQCKERANAAEVLWELLFEEAEAYYDRFYRPAGERKEDQGDSTWCPIKNHAQARLDKQCFRGREQLLADISERLEQHKNSPIFLWGVGGIGKTALACHFAVYEAKKYQVFFTTYSNSFKETIAKLELRNPDGGSITSSDMTVDQRYEIHMQALRKCTANIVLIIDNADSGTDLTRQDEYSELCLLDMQFIVTTRNDMQGDGRALYVGELSDDDCIKLMIQYHPSGESHINELREIADTLQYHTLAIELAAKTLEESGGRLTTNEILTALKAGASFDVEEWEPIHREYGDDYREKNAIQHLVSIFQVASLPPSERCVLGDFALANGMFQSNEVKDYWSREKVRLIHRLHAKGWIIKENGFFKLHPVIRCVVLVKREQCMSWDSNGEFVLSTMIYANVRLMHKAMKSIAGFHGYQTVKNSLKYMLNSVPNAYVGFLCSFLIYCYWSMDEILPKQEIDHLYDMALRSCESNNIVKYLIYDSYHRYLDKQEIASDERKMAYEKAYNMLWNTREHYYISDELLEVISRRISFLQGIADDVDGDSFKAIYSQERLMYELYILGWMVNDKELELNSAILWAYAIHYGQDYALWSPVIANAEMHMGAKDAKYFDSALTTIQAALRWPGRPMQHYYGILAGVAKLAIRICEISCRMDDQNEWQKKLVEAEAWLEKHGC